MRTVPSARTLLMAVLAALLLIQAVPAAAQAHCRGANTPVTRATIHKARVAVLCLHNVVRRAHGLHRLRANRRLSRAAMHFSRAMVRRNFFAHVSPTGSTVLTRARAAGYLRSGYGFTLGENIGWGGGRLSTPRSMVRMWMHSPGHRRNILDPSYRDVGIGLAPGTPAGSGGGTYTTDFGRRS